MDEFRNHLNEIFPGLSYRAACALYCSGIDSVDKLRELMKLPRTQVIRRVRNLGSISYTESLRFLNICDLKPSAQPINLDERGLSYLKGKKVRISPIKAEGGYLAFKIISIE